MKVELCVIAAAVLLVEQSDGPRPGYAHLMLPGDSGFGRPYEAWRALPPGLYEAAPGSGPPARDP